MPRKTGFTLFSFSFLFALSAALAAEPSVIKGEVHLNRLKEVDFTVPHPALIIVQDSVPLRLLGRYMEAGKAGKIQSNAKDVVLDREARYMSALCGSKGHLPQECMDQAAARAVKAGDVELVAVVRDFRQDSSSGISYRPGPMLGPFGPSAVGPAGPPGGFVPTIDANAGAEVFLFSLRPGRLLRNRRSAVVRLLL